jgi:hypothetical protein
MKDKNTLIRLVKDNGIYGLDYTGKRNGRGAYLCRNTDCFQKAYKRKGFDRSFKGSVPAELYGEINKKLMADNE